MNTEFGTVDVLLRGDRLADSFGEARGEVSAPCRRAMHVSMDWRDLSNRKLGDVLIVSSLREFSSRPKEISAAHSLRSDQKRFLMFCRDDMPPESVAEGVANLGVRTSDRLHVSHLVRDDEKSVFRRLIAGNTSAGPSILDAWLDGDEFVVISPAFARLRVPIKRLPKMNAAGAKELRRFEIDDFGDFVHWPSRDVHMGWSQFEQAAKPEAMLRASQKDAAFNKRYGAAIRASRVAAGLSQSSIDGLDARTVRRIELGQTRATAKALARLAAAQGLDATQYMNMLAGERGRRQASCPTKSRARPSRRRVGV